MQAPSSRVVYRFGDFELDAGAYELRRQGRRVPLARQPMDLLLVLTARAGQLVSREDIAAHLWGDNVFGDLDAGIHTAVLKVRKALGETKRRTVFLETVAGKGYRFMAPVEAVEHAMSQPIGVVVSADSSLRRRHNLPADLTSFIGRRSELESLPQVLTASRLLTLTGAGGVGKTRLAKRVAAAVRGQFADGVWLVDFGSLFDPGLLAETVATTLGLRESPHRSARTAVIEYARNRGLLLLLDTCEHLVGACAELVESLLCEAPQLRVMATSREALGVPGEILYRVPSLGLPDPSSGSPPALETESVRLFVERARATDAGFDPTVADVSAIARICHRLDGIPLAIELAAARTVALAPQQIETRLEDRFKFLTSGARHAVARQRTLEATVDWSYQLLPPDERLLLMRLAVFPASWTLAAAEAVCADEQLRRDAILDSVARLVNKSLVVFDSTAGHGERRYRLLDTVRDFAAARLSADESQSRVRARQFDWILARFRDSQRILRSAGQVVRLGELQLENASLRAALEWGLSSPERSIEAAELAGAVSWYWTKRGFFEEGKRWLQRAELLHLPPSTRARVLYGLAHMHYFQGRQPGVSACGAEVASLGAAAGDLWAVSVGAFLQALAAFELGELGVASEHAVAARAAADACGELVEHGGPLMILANVALVRDQQKEALRLYEASIEVHRRVHDSWGLSILLSITAGLRLVRGDVTQARMDGAEALSLCQALEDPRGIAWSLEVFAGVHAATGRAGDAARLWGLSDTLLETSGGALTATIGWIRDRFTAPVRNQLGEASFLAATAEGRCLSLDEAVALVSPPGR